LGKWLSLRFPILKNSPSAGNHYLSGEYAASPFADENQRHIDNASGQQAVRIKIVANHCKEIHKSDIILLQTGHDARAGYPAR
jgi:hypothetical protein